VTIATDHLSVDYSSLPLVSRGLRIRFEKLATKAGKPAVMLYPAAEPGFEPNFVRYAGGMFLKLGDGTVAQSTGQLVVTGRRLLGVVTQGSVGNHKLDDATGAVFAFVINREDMHPPQTKTNWRGKPVEAVIRSTEEQTLAFVLQVFSVVAAIKNDSSVAPTSLDMFLQRFTDEGQANLLAR
jgi:hypothetical protein